ncbi:MAG: DedA family protein [Microbacteriaceae bacterium]
MNEFIAALLDTVQSVDPVLRTLLAGFAIMLETSVLVGLFIPGDTVVLVASTGVEHAGEFVGLSLTVIMGALIGESLGFAIGRYFGPKLRNSRLGVSIGEQNWRHAENFIDHRGGIAVFISRFLPVLHSLVPVTAGMSSMRYRTFMLWTAPACTIWTFAYVSVGSVAAEKFSESADSLHTAGYWFVGALVAFAIVLSIVKKMLTKYAQPFEESPGDRDPSTSD